MSFNINFGRCKCYRKCVHHIHESIFIFQVLYHARFWHLEWVFSSICFAGTATLARKLTVRGAFCELAIRFKIESGVNGVNICIIYETFVELQLWFWLFSHFSRRSISWFNSIPCAFFLFRVDIVSVLEQANLKCSVIMRMHKLRVPAKQYRNVICGVRSIAMLWLCECTRSTIMK